MYVGGKEIGFGSGARRRIRGWGVVGARNELILLTNYEIYGQFVLEVEFFCVLFVILCIFVFYLLF